MLCILLKIQWALMYGRHEARLDLRWCQDILNLWTCFRKIHLIIITNIFINIRRRESNYLQNVETQMQIQIIFKFARLSRVIARLHRKSADWKQPSPKNFVYTSVRNRTKYRLNSWTNTILGDYEFAQMIFADNFKQLLKNETFV